MNLDDMEELLGPAAVPPINRQSVPIRIVEQEHAPLLANRTTNKGFYVCKAENPRQRRVLELSAAGKTNKEIAEIMGYHPVSISKILHQDHTQQTLVDEIRRNVDKIDEEVLQVVKEGCLEGAKRMLQIVKNPKAKESSQVAAAIAFMERRYGKANQPVNRPGDVDLNNLSDAQLARELVNETTHTGTTTAED